MNEINNTTDSKEYYADVYQTMFADYPDIVGAEQLGAMLGLTYRTICRLVREGKIPRMPDGKKIRVAKIEVINYVLHRVQNKP